MEISKEKKNVLNTVKLALLLIGRILILIRNSSQILWCTLECAGAKWRSHLPGLLILWPSTGSEIALSQAEACVLLGCHWWESHHGTHHSCGVTLCKPCWTIPGCARRITYWEGNLSNEFNPQWLSVALGNGWECTTRDSCIGTPDTEELIKIIEPRTRRLEWVSSGPSAILYFCLSKAIPLIFV